MKQLILDKISDLCADFLYYNRKEDEELSAEQLIIAVDEGKVTIDEMVQRFREVLEENLPKPK